MVLSSMSWSPGATHQVSVVRVFFTVGLMIHLLCVGVCLVCPSPYRTRGCEVSDIGPGRRWWQPLSLGPPLEARVIGGGTLGAVLLGLALCLLGSLALGALCQNLVSVRHNLTLNDSRDVSGVGHHGDLGDVKTSDVIPQCDAGSRLSGDGVKRLLSHRPCGGGGQGAGALTVPVLDEEERSDGDLQGRGCWLALTLQNERVRGFGHRSQPMVSTPSSENHH